MEKSKRMDTRKLTGLAIFTAIVFVLEAVSIAFARAGIFTFTLALAPIVVGAALYGAGAGAWLGFVFSFVVLISGEAAPFMAVNIPGTIITVIIKGTLAGYVSGLVYKALSKHEVPALVAAAISAPITNTGIFLIGCLLFFMRTITEWAEGFGFASVGNYIVFGLVGINFLIEITLSIVLSPVIVRLVKIGKKENR